MKKIVSLLLCLCLSVLLPFPAAAQSTEPYIVDDADLLTPDQEAALEAMAESIGDEYQIYPIIVTVDSLNGAYVESFADDYYDNNYGYDSGILLLLAMDTREWAISTCGDAIYALTDYGLQELFSAMAGYLSENEFYEAFDAYLSELPRYFEAFEMGEPIDGYQGGYDGPGTYEPGSRDDVIYYDRAPGLSDYLRIIFLSLLIGAAVGGIAILVMRGQMNTAKAQSGASSYLVDNSFDLTRRLDIFLYSRVNRTRRAQDSNGGRGGGSSVHRSSGGRSHGGSHGRF